MVVHTLYMVPIAKKNRLLRTTVWMVHVSWSYYYNDEWPKQITHDTYIGTYKNRITNDVGIG